MAIHSKLKIKDKYFWTCSARPRHEISIRNNSIFEGLKSSMLSIIKNICFWSTNTLQNTVSQELRSDHNTISAWILNLRGLFFLKILSCSVDMMKAEIVKL
jgi:hypothetical protein